MWCLKLVVVCLIVVGGESDCPNVKTELSGIRKRRHITFPDGADFVMTISLLKAFMTHAPSGWNLALEIDVLFPLPDANFTNSIYRRKLHHRQKREFWERIEDALDYHNLNGQACVLRSICEARTHLAEPGRSLVHDLLRTIFTAPLDEQGFVDEVGGRYGGLLDPQLCDKANDCPVSLLQVVLALNKQRY